MKDRDTNIEAPCMMKTADLPDEEPLKTLNGKPYSAILTAFFLGIALFIAGWWYHGAIVLGALVTGLALFVQVKGKSYIQFAFYPDYFVVFTQEDSDHCQKIDWKDVKEWTIDTNHGTAQTLQVRLASCPVPLRVPLLSSHRLYHIFHQKFPDLETAEIRRRMFRQKASQGSLFHRK